MNKEIEIPEGYEARIDGNKVIIELKESEDERIRKSLVKYFEKFNPKDMWDEMLSIGDVLAYFEKQKEQKPIDIDFVSDWLRKHTKTYVNSEYNEFHKTVEYDGSINIEHLIEDLKKAMEQQSFAHENDFVSKPAEWSDSVAKEMFIKALERAVEQTKKGYELTDCDKHSWWEDFKAYSGIKPAEWSEEDKRAIDRACVALRAYSNGDLPYFLPSELLGYADRLQSLLPQPYWKPSEEQMKALSYVKEYFKDVPSANKEYVFLVQLYDDLEKL